MSLTAVKMLLDLGLDVNAADDQGATALHGAAARGANDIIRLLVEQGRASRREDQAARAAADRRQRAAAEHSAEDAAR